MVLIPRLGHFIDVHKLFFARAHPQNIFFGYSALKNLKSLCWPPCWAVHMYSTALIDDIHTLILPVTWSSVITCTHFHTQTSFNSEFCVQLNGEHELLLAGQEISFGYISSIANQKHFISDFYFMITTCIYSINNYFKRRFN